MEPSSSCWINSGASQLSLSSSISHKEGSYSDVRGASAGVVSTDGIASTESRDVGVHSGGKVDWGGGVVDGAVWTGAGAQLTKRLRPEMTRANLINLISINTLSVGGSNEIILFKYRRSMDALQLLPGYSDSITNFVGLISSVGHYHELDCQGGEGWNRG